MIVTVSQWTVVSNKINRYTLYREKCLMSWKHTMHGVYFLCWHEY